MTSDAEVWRRKASSTPSAAPTSVTKRTTSRVISMKPSPPVSTASRAVEMVGAATWWAGSRRADIKLAKAGTSRSTLLIRTLAAVEVLLHPLDHVDEPAPHLFQEHHQAIEIGIARQFQLLIAGLCGAAIGLDQAAGGKLPPEGGVLVLKPTNLALERGAILGHGLAGPADGSLAAKGDLAGAAVEPHDSIGHILERVAAVLRIG